jgi:hypothetical protein
MGGFNMTRARRNNRTLASLLVVCALDRTMALHHNVILISSMDAIACGSRPLLHTTRGLELSLVVTHTLVARSLAVAIVQRAMRCTQLARGLQ